MFTGRHGRLYAGSFITPNIYIEYILDVIGDCMQDISSPQYINSIQYTIDMYTNRRKIYNGKYTGCHRRLYAGSIIRPSRRIPVSNTLTPAYVCCNL